MWGFSLKMKQSKNIIKKSNQLKNYVYSIRQLHLRVLVLALYCNHRLTETTDCHQKAYFKQSNNTVVEKSQSNATRLAKTMSSSYHMKKKIIEVICGNKIHTGENLFVTGTLKICESYLFRWSKKIYYTLVCISLLYIFREEKTK